MRSLVLLLLASLPAPAATCESMAALSLPHTIITDAHSYAAGEFLQQNGQRNLPAFCRVQGVVKPVEDSEIPFEVWLPAARWNGKFRGVGNGGFAGSISQGELAAAVKAGYAAAGTDTGHHASGTDATWALGHPQKVIDFGWRAIHETAEKGKAITAAFYGEAPRRSYFNGCSDGGREALMEAQRFPEDYDGIVAGAPANYWTHLLIRAVWDVQALMNDPAAYIPASKIPAIEDAALKACDALDGVTDGVIDDPSRCKFDPAVLLCKEGDEIPASRRRRWGRCARFSRGRRLRRTKRCFPDRR
jgi:feruloyl esterase